jgi:hypothetical protein
VLLCPCYQVLYKYKILIRNILNFIFKINFKEVSYKIFLKSHVLVERQNELK